MDLESTDDPRLNAWPFWILELSPSASTSDIENAFNSLNGKLSLGASNVSTYSTPFGKKPRDEFKLREAKSILITPESRLLAEFWYVDPQALQTFETKEQLSPLDIFRITPVQKRTEKR